MLNKYQFVDIFFLIDLLILAILVIMIIRSVIVNNKYGYLVDLSLTLYI